MLDAGSLGGIYTGLMASESHYTLVVPCDMPFLSVPILRYLLALCTAEKPATYDVIVPTLDDYPQGLHAIYSKACTEPIKAKLEAKRLKVIGFYDAVRVRYVAEDELAPFDNLQRAFFNTNTPAELETARQIIESNNRDSTT